MMRTTRTTCRTTWRTRPSSGCTRSGRQDATKPFFGYFSTGCSHAPHHVAENGRQKYEGKFDQGWDRLREETFARQKELGVIPPDAELTERDDAFPAWEDVPDKLKAYYARQMEVYAGYSENADHNVGRVIDAIDELGELDNTLIFWIWGDNGASMEGTITGSFNELTMQNGIPLDRRDAAPARRALRRGGGVGEPDDGAPLLRRLGVGGQHAVQVGEAGGLAPRWNPQSAWWPTGRTRSERAALCDRTSPTSSTSAPRSWTSRESRCRPTSTGSSSSRCTARPSPTRWRTPELPSATPSSTSRPIGNRAMYKDGWWLAMRTERIPWVITPEALQPYTPGRLGPGPGPCRALLPSRRLHPGAGPRRGQSREGEGAQGALLGRRPRSTRCLPLLATLVRVLRDRAAAARGPEIRVPRRRPERPLGDDPADL